MTTCREGRKHIELRVYTWMAKTCVCVCVEAHTLRIKSGGVPGRTVGLRTPSWCEWISVSSRSRTRIFLFTASVYRMTTVSVHFCIQNACIHTRNQVNDNDKAMLEVTRHTYIICHKTAHRHRGGPHLDISISSLFDLIFTEHLQENCFPFSQYVSGFQKQPTI